MISTTDPESMTAQERQLEVANILAQGLLRRVRLPKTAALNSQKISLKSLDLVSKIRLSVAQRPVG
jgi:hypothetical protein